MRNFLIILTVLGVFQVQAQYGGVGLLVGLPQNEFNEETDATGIGANLTVLFPVGGEVLGLGGSINYQVYGFYAQNETLFADITAGGTLIDRIEIPLRIINTSSIFSTHLDLRITAPTDFVRPYIEGLFGFRYISTSTKIKDLTDDNRWTGDPEDDVLVRKTNLADFILSYGGGAGLLIETGGDSFVDLRVTYLLGGEAEFFDGEDTEQWQVEFTNDPTFYDPSTVSGDDLTFGATPKRSTTDMLVLQFGIVFQF